MVTLEKKVKEYIKENSKETGNVALPLSQIAEEVNSSTATVWRVIQKLEKNRVVKVVKPKLKTEPNSIFYLGEENELLEIIDDMMLKTANLMILMKELKAKVREKDDIIFELKRNANVHK